MICKVNIIGYWTVNVIFSLFFNISWTKQLIEKIMKIIFSYSPNKARQRRLLNITHNEYRLFKHIFWGLLKIIRANVGKQ